MDDLIERIYNVPTGKKITVQVDGNPDGAMAAAEEATPVAGFLFTREGLVRLLSEVKYSSKTVHKFLEGKHIKYL